MGMKVLNPTNLSFLEGTKTYVNYSLYPYCKVLWNECKKLWNNKKIYSYFNVNVNITVNGTYTHQRFEGSIS